MALVAIARRCRPLLKRSNDESMSSRTGSLFLLQSEALQVPRAYQCRWASSSSDFGPVNGEIRAKKVNLVDNNGTMHENMPISKAMNMAKESKVDLVQVAQNGNSVVCRLFDVEKRKFRMKKNQKAQKPKVDKEVVFSAKIANNDLKMKVEQAKKFLSKGHKVKVTIKWGRQTSMKPQAEEQMDLIRTSIGMINGVPGPAPTYIGGGFYLYFSPANK